MKILYHNPTCGSGIEQAGYIYLFLLKKLGHEIDLWNTQCASLQENDISKTIKNYDAIVLNSAYTESFKRMIPHKVDNVFSIAHEIGEDIPSFCKLLSLNFPLQYKLMYRLQKTNVIFPVTYPYYYGKTELSEEREYKFVFVGRWNEYKFDRKVKTFMKDNGISVDMAYISSSSGEGGYEFSDIVKDYKMNATIDEVHELLSKSKYLLLPSTTECISFVVGEALVNGCIPIVYDTKEKEHEQFFNAMICYSMEEFNQRVISLRDADIGGLYDRKKVAEFSRKMWNIDKSLEGLRTIFGEGNSGKVRIMFNDHDISLATILPYRNACIITGESL